MAAAAQVGLMSEIIVQWNSAGTCDYLSVGNESGNIP
jgi:hypothetical protein